MREKASFRIACVAAAVLIVIVTAFIPTPEGLSFEGKMQLGILLGCVVLWISEAIPILATAWLFAASVPIMGIMAPMDTWMAGVSVAMVVCISCFAFALFVQKSSISLRIIALILRWSKNDSNKAIAGMMIATALLSTIIDDLILVLMMLPFAYKILDENHTPWGSKSNLAKALILGIAFASYIGGWITPVGSVVNIFAMQFAEQATGVTVTFANWMVLGFIMCIVTLPLAYLGIIKIFKPEPITDEALQRIESEYKALPSLTKDEIWGSLVILGALILWILSSWFPQFDLVVVGLVAFGLMFLPPFKCINFREYAKESAWEVVMLNWGVGCFVAGITATGAMAWLVNSIFGSMSAIPLVVILLLVAIFACVLHNILPAGAAVAGLITVPVTTLVMSLGGSVTAAIMLCAVFSTAAFMIPLDLCVYVAYSSERKYFTMLDQVKVGWVPSIVAIAMVVFVMPAVSGVMGLA